MSLIYIKNVDELSQIMHSSKLSLIMVSTTTCPPCRRFTPIVEEVSKSPDFFNIQFVKVNLDEVMDANDLIGAGSVPTLIFWKDNKEIHREIGALDKEKLINLVTSYFK